MKKHICAIILSFVISMGGISFNAAAVSDKDIEAPSAVLMDSTSGKVLFEKNSHEKRACASITKVMTVILVMEALDSGKIKLEDIVTASEHASSMGGSDIWLEPGETMTVDDMLKATLIASANDAAVALAEHISGSEDSFVRKMNEKAASLGMKETTFKNCNGLDEEGHLTSAYDVGLMTRELLKHKAVLKYTGTRISELRGGKTQLVNTNKLLRTYNGITGMKTGTTSQAGSCITATAERDGLSLISVVLGCSTGKQRFTDAAALLDYGFANYMMYTPEIPEGAATTINVERGVRSAVNTKTSPAPCILMEKDKAGSIESKIILPETVTAPINKGDNIGKVEYYSDSKLMADTPIVAAEDVQEISIAFIFSKIFTLSVGAS